MKAARLSELGCELLTEVRGPNASELEFGGQKAKLAFNRYFSEEAHLGWFDLLEENIETVLPENYISWHKVEHISKPKTFPDSSVIVLWGGPSSMVAARIETDMSTLLDRTGKCGTREVARLLVRYPGALEILLMLEDVGPVSTDGLTPSAVDAQHLDGTVAELRRCEMVTVQGKTVYLTERGTFVVRKLRAALREAKTKDVKLESGR